MAESRWQHLHAMSAARSGSRVLAQRGATSESSPQISAQCIRSIQEGTSPSYVYRACTECV